ncbi:MAG: hypothetical protein RLZZ387_165 [Chloroflexota bacterium]
MTKAPPADEKAASRPGWVMHIPKPAYRYLRGYAFDPSLSSQIDTIDINEAMFKVPWEHDLKPGPVGEYLEVVDYDPSSQCFYEPVDLNAPEVLAQNGLPLSESSPQFHQQYVYAVAMTTIKNFEQALGRRAAWRSLHVDRADTERPDDYDEHPVRLRIYPHALRAANAYYSPDKVALLFGYFPATAQAPGTLLPRSTVFSCLSHDIIAHETTHALLDGVHQRLVEPTNPDVRAFHEAFADIVALLQHFTFPEVLRHQIARTRGDLVQQNLLGELAQQFGYATGRNGALRSAIGGINPETKQWEAARPDPHAYQTELAPHRRGAILVAAVFDAFLTIYRRRVADLMRIATNGSGVLPAGALHPDLVNRLAAEAARTAEQALHMCIRAIDYMLPIDITFGDYLRALITADYDLVPEDTYDYRVAFIEAFRRRGIYPKDVRSLSVESVRWPIVDESKFDIFTPIVDKLLKGFAFEVSYLTDRREAARVAKNGRSQLHTLIRETVASPKYRRRVLDLTASQVTGLVLTAENPAFKANPNLLTELGHRDGNPLFEVHALWPLQRMGPRGTILNHLLVQITQRRRRTTSSGAKMTFRGGATLIIDLSRKHVRYVIPKSILDEERLQEQERYENSALGLTLDGTGADEMAAAREPFALLHNTL